MNLQCIHIPTKMADDDVDGDDRRKQPRDDDGAEKTKKLVLKPCKTVQKRSKTDRKRPENNRKTAERGPKTAEKEICTIGYMYTGVVSYRY